MAALQRVEQRERIVAAAGELQRALGELVHALLLAGEVQRVGQAREQPRGERALLVAEGRERAFEQFDRLVVDRAGVRVVAEPAEGGLGEHVGEVLAGGDLRREHERVVGVRVVQPRGRGAEADQQPGAPRLVVLEALERGGVVRLGLEVGQPLGRGDRGLLGVVDGLALAVQVTALDVVVGELGGRRELELVERLRDPVVQAHAPGRALALVQRLAHERVGEREAVRVVGDLAHQRRPRPPARAR